MCHLQAHIDDTQQNPLARVGLRQTGIFVDGRRVNPLGCNIHQHLATHMVLDALYLLVVSQCLQLADRYIGYVNVTNTGDGLATIFSHHCLCVAIETNHSTNRFMLLFTLSTMLL